MLEFTLGSKGEAINVKLFPLPNGDFMGEFTPKKIGRENSSEESRVERFAFVQVSIELISPLMVNQSMEIPF